MAKPLLAPVFVACAASALSPSGWALSPEEVFGKAAPSVVMVFAGERQSRSVMQGSGVVVGIGKVITNCHVVLRKDGVPAKEITVSQGDKTLRASFVAGNREYDTCLLAAVGLSRRAAVVADTSSLRVGQRVYAIGAPSGLDLTLTEGLLSGLRIKGKSKVIQTSAAISPGSSGGGLFDDHGDLIGITSFGIGTGTGLNFAYMPDAILELVQLSNSVQAARSSSQPDAPSPATALQDRSMSEQWLSDMSQRLERRIPNREYREELLRALHYEATRAGLDPQMVLGLIDTVNGFKKFAVSSHDARGYMQVVPAWVQLIGRPDDDLFHLRTNLRYGCTILRHYLDIENGDLFRALAHYEHAMVDGPGAEIGANPDARFPNRVRAAWEGTWGYKVASSR